MTFERNSSRQRAFLKQDTGTKLFSYLVDNILLVSANQWSLNFGSGLDSKMPSLSK